MDHVLADRFIQEMIYGIKAYANNENNIIYINNNYNNNNLNSIELKFFNKVLEIAAPLLRMEIRNTNGKMNFIKKIFMVSQDSYVMSDEILRKLKAHYNVDDVFLQEVMDEYYPN